MGNVPGGEAGKREAANLQEFALLNKDVNYIACPKVYPELCRENILVMEYVDGIPISNFDKLRAANYDGGNRRKSWTTMPRSA